MNSCKNESKAFIHSAVKSWAAREEKATSPNIIEGIWEEIESHKAEWMGRHLRVIVTPDEPAAHEPAAAESRPKLPPKKLVGFGALTGIIGSSEEFAREKQLEIEREDRGF